MSTRRDFLRHGAGAVGASSLALVLGSLGCRPAPVRSTPLGPLVPTADEATGLPLLCLPEGFRYRSISWAGEETDEGYPVPGRFDGMGIVADENGTLVFVRNHERRGSDGPIGDPARSWDVTGGGTTTFWFDPASERVTRQRISLSGTLNNCAGGVTPWGTWLSCEEAPYTPELAHLGVESRQRNWGLAGARRPHGYIFEVHPEGEDEPVPLTDMGQLYQEAAVVDAERGFVYQTEDQEPEAGFYRFLPNEPGKLAAGGRLQMMRVQGLGDLRGALEPGRRGDVQWVDIEKPGQGHRPGTHDTRGVVAQGVDAGGSAFISLEGCAMSGRDVFFTSKRGGAKRQGQVFRYDTDEETLELVWESPGTDTFSGPDNIVMSPQGYLILCEDAVGRGNLGAYLCALTPAAELIDFCRINPALQGEAFGFDLARTARVAEWAGACFSPDGQWLFANVYAPGITVAITGPWSRFTA